LTVGAQFFRFPRERFLNQSNAGDGTRWRPVVARRTGSLAIFRLYRPQKKILDGSWKFPEATRKQTIGSVPSVAMLGNIARKGESCSAEVSCYVLC
jgi:hypothetical protein